MATSYELDEIEFIVDGPPHGKGRPRFARRGQYVTTYTDKRTVEYEKHVSWCAMEAMGIRHQIWTGPITVDITFVVRRPKSKCRKKDPDERIPCMTKPDIDNAIKAILDGMSSIVYTDDKNVIRVSASKWYGEKEEAPHTLGKVRVEGRRT